jgi:hypothetical protein
MAGLVPAIHVLLAQRKDVDARHKAGHDEARGHEMADVWNKYEPTAARKRIKPGRETRPKSLTLDTHAHVMVPRPLQANAAKPTKYGVIYFGSTAPAMDEAIGLLEARGHQLDRMRIRAFPFHSSVASFVADHDFVYVVEQNRDAQLRQLIVNENGIDPVRLVPILHYDGTPITARFIASAIGDHQDHLKVTPLRKAVS